MDSATAKHGLAELCLKKDTTILHVGDWDPGGISIYEGIALDVPAMMHGMRERCAPMRDFKFERVAVFPEHIAQYGLLTGTRKPGDKDKCWFPGIDGDPDRTCQVEALPPDVLVNLVQRAVR